MDQYFFLLILLQLFEPVIKLILPLLDFMESEAKIEANNFHHYSKSLRLNNPTFNSNFVSDSLTQFTPQKNSKELNKGTEYKSKYEPLTDSINTLNCPHKYARISKQAFEKNRSQLSHYGSNCISQSILPKK